MPLLSIGSHLRRKTAQLKGALTHHSQSTVQEMYNLVQDYKRMVLLKQLLSKHLDVVQVLQELLHSSCLETFLELETAALHGTTAMLEQYLSTLLHRCAPIVDVVRLYVLLHTVGCSTAQFLNTFRTTVYSVYGIAHLSTLIAVETVLRAWNLSAAQWRRLTQILELLHDPSNSVFPTQPSLHLYQHYVPLSVRCIQCMLHSSHFSALPRPLLTALRIPPGPVFEYSQVRFLLPCVHLPR
uniref:Vacuolar protein sorting-associated protein 33A n=1 Tax=Lygus hesperus TaxID=30085 RepID=A0A0A9XIN1_LYGHE